MTVDEAERLRQVLGAFYKTVDVMKSARNQPNHIMHVWADDMKAVEDVMFFLEQLRDTGVPAQRPVNPARETFETWFNRRFLDPDGGDAHLPDWLKDDLRSAWDAASAPSTGLPAPAPHVEVREAIERAAGEIVRRVSEWDDRTSPEDWPEAMLITGDELRDELLLFADEIRALALPQSTERGEVG